MNKWMIWGVFPYFCGNTHIFDEANIFLMKQPLSFSASTSNPQVAKGYESLIIFCEFGSVKTESILPEKTCPKYISWKMSSKS